jgi:hypothetical protein
LLPGEGTRFLLSIKTGEVNSVKKSIDPKVAAIIIVVVVVIVIVVGYLVLGKKPGGGGGGEMEGKWTDSRSGKSPEMGQGGGGVRPDGTKITGPPGEMKGN